MASIGWNAQPSDTDSAGLGDDVIRSLKTSLQIGLSGEHTWPSAGGDAGVHLLGSARAFVAAQSLVSSSGTDGRLMFASDSSRFFHVGSGGSSYIGSPYVLEIFPHPSVAAPTREIWAEEHGVGYMPAGSTSTTIAFTGFNGIPIIVQSTWTDGGAGDVSAIKATFLRSVGQTSFILTSAQGDGASMSNFSFFWRSMGTRTL